MRPLCMACIPKKVERRSLQDYEIVTFAGVGKMHLCAEHCGAWERIQSRRLWDAKQYVVKLEEPTYVGAKVPVELVPAVN